MNVGVIGHGFWPQVGGLERQVYDVATGLGSTEAVTVVATCGEGSPYASSDVHCERFGSVEVRRYTVPSDRFPRDHPPSDPSILLDYYLERVEDWAGLLGQVDVICAFGVVPCIAAGEIKRRCAIPMVAVLPGVPDGEDAAFAAALDADADVLVSVSQFMQRRARDLFGVEFVNIYNGVDGDFYRPSQEQLPYGFLDDVKAGTLITSPVRLDPGKGIPFLLQSFAILREKHPMAHLLITGNGSIFAELDALEEYFQELLARAAELGIGEHVTFARGAVAAQHMPALYSKSTVSVMASYTEGFGLGIAESLACETPVVACHSEGMQEVFEHGTGGLFVNYGDADGLADAIDTMLTDPDYRATMGRQGREHVLATFPLSKQTTSYQRLLRELVS